MAPTENPIQVARVFARAVIRRKWADLAELFASTARSHHTAPELEAAFGWDQLGPRLRQEHIALTGEPEEMVPYLDPPKRFEVFDVMHRDPPEGHDPAVPVAWVEIEFLPAEDSGFDQCYRCFLAFIDEGGSRILTYAIKSPTE